MRPIRMRSIIVSLIASACVVACSAAQTEDQASNESAIAIPIVAPQLVDGNVRAFKALDASVVYVLGTDGNLWRETGTMSSRAWVDGNVLDFQPTDGTVVYVLGTDHKLWREVGSMYSRTLVATNVDTFSAGDANNVYIVQAGLLSLSTPSAGPRALASAVKAIQAVDASTFYTLRTDNRLWHGDPTTPLDYLVDANVSSFRAFDAMTVFVEGSDTTLWNEKGTFQTRTYVDANVQAFRPATSNDVFVQGTDGKLWRTQYSNRDRDLVDQSVAQFQPIGDLLVYVMHADGNLYRESLPNPVCNFAYPSFSCDAPWYPFIAGWAVRTASGTCPDIASPAGRWTVNTTFPVMPLTTPPTCSSVFPTGSCCTYFWVGNGTSTMQDASVLCNANDTAVEALGRCGKYCPPGAAETCVEPFGGGCDTCSIY